MIGIAWLPLSPSEFHEAAVWRFGDWTVKMIGKCLYLFGPDLIRSNRRYNQRCVSFGLGGHACLVDFHGHELCIWPLMWCEEHGWWLVGVRPIFVVMLHWHNSFFFWRFTASVFISYHQRRRKRELSDVVVPTVSLHTASCLRFLKHGRI